MAATAAPLVPGTAEWQRLITASKVAAILGLSPFDSPLSTWHKMKGNVPLEQETDDHRRGHYAEPAILAWFKDQHPELLGVLQPQFKTPGLPWAAATPDALAINPDTKQRFLVEAKTARSLDEWGEPGTDEVPAYYYVQAMFQMHLARVPRCYVPVWGSWFEMAEYVIDYDADIANGIIARCAEFWASLEANEPPPLDDTVATIHTLKALHPLIEDKEVVYLDDDVAIEFIEASNDFKAAEARKRAAQSAVLDAMGNAQKALVGQVTVARRQPNKTGVSLYAVAKTTEAFL